MAPSSVVLVRWDWERFPEPEKNVAQLAKPDGKLLEEQPITQNSYCIPGGFDVEYT